MQIIISIMMSILSLFGCGNQNEAFQTVDVTTFAKQCATDSVQVLDVRTPEEYAEGHLVNAINIDVTAEGFIQKATTKLDSNKTIAVYCRSGKRSALAAKQLSEKGYKVINLDGGILAWIQESKPVIR